MILLLYDWAIPHTEPCIRGGHPVSPGYLWQLVRGGVYPENLWLQLVWEGLSVVPGGPLEKFSKLQLVFWVLNVAILKKFHWNQAESVSLLNPVLRTSPSLLVFCGFGTKNGPSLVSLLPIWFHFQNTIKFSHIRGDLEFDDGTFQRYFWQFWTRPLSINIWNSIRDFYANCLRVVQKTNL